MTSVPDVTPVAVPASIVALVLLALHVPPVADGVRTIEDPWQTTDGPDNDGGEGRGVILT